MRKISFIAIAVFLLLGAHCGYKPVLSSKFIWGDVRTVCVATFADRTEQPGLGGMVTEALREEIARYGEVKLTSCDEADAVLSGEVADFNLSPISFAGAEFAAEFRIIVKLKTELTKRETGEALWEGSDLWSAEEYFAVPDLSLLVVAKKEASAKAIKKLAQLISAELFAF